MVIYLFPFFYSFFLLFFPREIDRKVRSVFYVFGRNGVYDKEYD